jgi:citrate synthase
LRTSSNHTSKNISGPCDAPKGLQDVVANESSICFIDGGKGILSYRGIDIHELAQKSTFEETTYLLWNGALPTARSLNDFFTTSWPPRGSFPTT